MKKVGLITLLLVFSVSVSSAVEVTCFSGEFVRGTGSPVVKTENLPGVIGSATLRVYNGAEDDSFERVSSSIVKVNGVNVLGQKVFNQNVDYLETEIQLAEQNTISVELRGKPGGKIKVDISQNINNGQSIVKPLNRSDIVKAPNGVIEFVKNQIL